MQNFSHFACPRATDRNFSPERSNNPAISKFAIDFDPGWRRRRNHSKNLSWLRVMRRGFNGLPILVEFFLKVIVSRTSKAEDRLFIVARSWRFDTSSIFRLTTFFTQGTVWMPSVISNVGQAQECLRARKPTAISSSLLGWGKKIDDLLTKYYPGFNSTPFSKDLEKALM